jgi:hypothetical protein
MEMGAKWSGAGVFGEDSRRTSQAPVAFWLAGRLSPMVSIGRSKEYALSRIRQESIRKFSAGYVRDGRTFSAKTAERICALDWPGGSGCLALMGTLQPMCVLRIAMNGILPPSAHVFAIVLAALFGF